MHYFFENKLDIENKILIYNMLRKDRLKENIIDALIFNFSNPYFRYYIHTKGPKNCSDCS